MCGVCFAANGGQASERDSIVATIARLASNNGEAVAVVSIGVDDIDRATQVEREIASALCLPDSGGQRRWTSCQSSTSLGIPPSERTVVRAKALVETKAVDVVAMLFLGRGSAPSFVRVFRHRADEGASEGAQSRAEKVELSLSFARDPEQLRPPAPTLSSPRPSQAMVDAFRQRAIMIVPVGKATDPIFRVQSEPMTFVLPDGREVHSTEVLRFIDEDDLAARRSFAVTAAPFTTYGAIFGGLGFVFAGIGIGAAIGYDQRGFEGGMFGVVGGLALSSLVAVPAALAIGAIPLNVSPSEEDVLDAVRRFNLTQARPLSVDVVDLPFQYLGE